MIDIEKIKPEIIERLKPLNPDKIILFGSYAYGTPNEDSDIDLFLINDSISETNLRNHRLELEIKLLDLQKKYLIGLDLFLDTSTKMQYRSEVIGDQFYKEILEKGVVIYAK